jgi:hypothetical protein
MSANRILILLIGILLLTAPGIGQDGPTAKTASGGRLLVFLPYDASVDRMKRWAAEIGKHCKFDYDLLLVAVDPANLREDRLIEIAQAVQAGLPGASLGLATEKDLELLDRCKVTRLPAYVHVNKRTVHIWQGAGQWQELLSCTSK